MDVKRISYIEVRKVCDSGKREVLYNIVTETGTLG
jgi:hypothetical protein